MSEKLISRNPELQQLRNEGYDISVNNGFLVIHSVPYVNSSCEIALGKVVTDLTLNNDKVQVPGDHQVWFAGEHPCNKDGSIISAIKHTSTTQTLSEGLVVNHRFSCKPKGGYPDYYTKMTRYVEIITHQAQAIDPTVTARGFKPTKAQEEDSVFLYTDSASSRAGIASLNRKLAMDKIAFIGLGGTGSYALDLVCKTHVKAIHLFDGDKFFQHNAFRAPGAASISDLKKSLLKVDYYSNIYSQMRRNIYPHPYHIDAETIHELTGFDFVFLCVDKPAVRKLVSDYLHEQKIPFIDVGMELELIEEKQCLIGTCRVTMSTPEKSTHFPKHVSLKSSVADEVYVSNIQIADLNALNASLAVIKWKKYCGYYQDFYNEHHSIYALNVHQLTNDEMGLKN